MSTLVYCVIGLRDKLFQLLPAGGASPPPRTVWPGRCGTLLALTGRRHRRSRHGGSPRPGLRVLRQPGVVRDLDPGPSDAGRFADAARERLPNKLLA